MLSSELKKGQEIRLSTCREATVTCGKRGIIREIKIKPVNGWHPDQGDNYIDEIAEVKVNGEWEKFELTPAHAKKMKLVREMLDMVGFTMSCQYASGRR